MLGPVSVQSSLRLFLITPPPRSPSHTAHISLTGLHKIHFCFVFIEVELADNRVGTFRNYFRMNDAQFQSILEAISDDIEKMPTCAVPITPRERLMVCAFILGRNLLSSMMRLRDLMTSFFIH